MNATFSGEGRGKLILFGEHSVVYGRLAVACGIPGGARASLFLKPSATWRVTHPGGSFDADDDVLRAGRLLLRHFDLRPEDLAIDVDLTIPVGAGLGSSAAMAVAIARAACDLREIPADQRDPLVTSAVNDSEGVLHGKASGIDQQAACHGGFFQFQRPAITTPVEAPPRRWLIARVAPSASTARMVGAVADLHESYPQVTTQIFDTIDLVARRGAAALRVGDYREVGALMNFNQGLLGSLGVSTPDLEDACYLAREAGALGAKITGAGGGGCILVLPPPGPPEECFVLHALEETGDVYEVTLPVESP